MSKLRVDKIAAPIVQDEFTGSVYFDGYGSTAGGYLEIPKAPFQFLHKLTDSWTVECWVYKGKSDQGTIFDTGGSSSTTIGTAVYINSDNTLRLRIRQALSATVVSEDYTIADPVHKWNHFALSFDGSKFRIFWNGVLLGKVSYSTESATDSTQELRIGVYKTASGFSGYWNGYISNFRICKGHAVYTENFTVPTRELPVHKAPPKGVVFPAADNVTVLLACQDANNPLTDSSGRHTITGAGRLGGVPGQNLVNNGDFGSNSDWDNYVSPTTSELSTDQSYNGTNSWKIVADEALDGITQTFSSFTTVTGVKYVLSGYFYSTTGEARIRWRNGTNDGWLFDANVGDGTANVWQKFEIIKTETSGGSGMGVRLTANSSGTFYFDDISVTSIPPISDANPGLLRRTLNFTTVTENTGSVFFDDSGDYLAIPIGTDFDLGTGDFTIETWWWREDTGTGNKLWTLGDSKTANGMQLYVGSGPALKVYHNNAARLTATSLPSQHEWHHYALTRENGTLKLYVDGTQDANTYDASSADLSGSSGTGAFFYIGVESYNGGFSYAGNKYISNFRICKGHAVYTSNFIPPTRELEVHEGPDDDRTVFLGLYDGENIFADKTGRHNHEIAAYGDRVSSPTPTATNSPIGITTFNPGLTRNVDPTAGPTFQGGVGYTSQNWLTLPKGTTTERYAGSNSANPAPRGLRASGQVAPNNAITNTVDSVEIATTGDALDFGDLITSKFGAGGIGSPTRGLFCGGGTPTRQSAIDYFTISTRGNGQDFGDIFGDTRTLAGATGGNATRGLTFGGATTSGTTNVIGYVTIATTGDAKDFGDCTKQNGSAVVCSPTRAVSAGGDSAANGSNINTIDFVTIQSMGNSLDFGDLLAQASGRGVSSITRGLFSTESPAAKRINYVTIATTGNAVDFGDLISNNASGGCASYSSLTRGCFAGLKTPTTTNTIEYFTIPTLGDALNFGDLTQSVNNAGGCSNGHGGLG